MDRYEIDKSGSQIYPRDKKSGNEMYLKLNGQYEVMAKKRDATGKLHVYFASNYLGFPIAPILHENMTYLDVDIPYPEVRDNQIYPKRDGKDFYIGVDKNCRYAKRKGGIEYYARYSLNSFYYAFRRNEKNEVIEFPRKNDKQKDTYIIINDPTDPRIIDKIIYPRNLTNQKILYPTDSNGKEMYIQENGKQFYPYQNDLPVYLKLENGQEVFALDETSRPYYAFTKINGSKNEFYPKLKNKKQFYLELDGSQIYAINRFNDQIYAKDERRIEYFAKTARNIPFYATNRDSIEIYPSFPYGRNIYKRQNDTEQLAENKKTKQKFYGKDEFMNEFYPKIFRK